MEPEVLLEHGDFVRGLAKSLLFDENTVDDVVQQTWLAYVQQPPRKAHATRSWLGTVVRHLAFQKHRSKKRLAKREEGAAKVEAIPSTADVIERESVRREVVDAVLALEEPYRSPILLRYYENLPPREIAKRLALPVETVHTHIRRGRDQLRRQLDAKHGGNRQAWCLGLIPIAASFKKAAATSGVAALIQGGILMSLKSKAAVAAIFLFAAGFSIYFSLPKGETHDQEQEAFVVSKQETSAEGPENSPRDPIGASSREPIDLEGKATPSVPVTKEPVASMIRGVVYDERGVPQPHLRLAFLSEEFRKRLETASLLRQEFKGVHAVPEAQQFASGLTVNGMNLGQLLDPLSHKELLDDVGLPAPEILASDGRGEFSFQGLVDQGLPCVIEPQWVTLSVEKEPTEGSELKFVVVATRVYALRGKIVDPHGGGIPGARVSWSIEAVESGGPGASKSRFPLSQTQGAYALANAEGEFLLSAAPHSGAGSLHFWAIGFETRKISVEEFIGNGALATLQPKSSWSIAGRIELRGRGPVRGILRWGNQQFTAGRDGLFRADLFAVEEETPLFIQSVDARPAVLPRFGERILRGETQFDLLLEERLSFRGRVVDEGGLPQPGCIVEIEDPTRMPPAGLNRHWLEITGRWESPVTDAQGRFEIPGVLDRPYRLIAIRPKTLEFARIGPVATTDGEIRIVMPGKSLRRKLSGRVVGADGVGVPNVVLELALATCATEGTFQNLEKEFGRTDAEGIFQIDEGVLPGTTLRCKAEGFRDEEILLDEKMLEDALRVMLTRQ